MRYQYRVFSGYLRKLPTHDLERASEIRDHVLKTIPINSGKRFIVRLSACCDYAMRSGWISENPFKGMASEIKLPKGEDAEMRDINPFSAQERDTILEAFRDNTFCPKFSRVKHSYYYPFINFLFNSGCRPSEAAALQWKHISEDFRTVLFEQAIVHSETGAVCKKGLKTQDRRRFPCNAKMQAFLSSIKPDSASQDDPVFPSPSGRWIESNNLRNPIWNPIIQELGIERRKLYQTRHTFITLALENGLDAKDVARLVGNSPEVIYRYYAGNKRELFVPEF
ncbi:MAG: tyrosine-type recombinase/integrase [Leptolyngbyaceae cyanobacterium]